MSLDKNKRDSDQRSNKLFSYASDETLDGKDFTDDLDEESSKVSDEIKIYDYLDENAVDYYNPYEDDVK